MSHVRCFMRLFLHLATHEHKYHHSSKYAEEGATGFGKTCERKGRR